MFFLEILVKWFTKLMAFVSKYVPDPEILVSLKLSNFLKSVVENNSTPYLLSFQGSIGGATPERSGARDKENVDVSEAQEATPGELEI